jgi:SAM-dependent methyltransferase
LLSAAIRNDMLRAFLAPGAADRIIDLGCGSGRALVWNQDVGGHLVGVDVSPHFAREARTGVDLLLGDLRRLPLADSSFTKAFSLDVLEHLSRETLVEVLREAGRVLEPGGALFIYTHVRKNSPLAIGLRAINRVAHGLNRLGGIDLQQEWLRKSDHVNPLVDIPDFERAAAETGFRLERIRYYTPLVGAVVENLVVRVAEKVLARRAVRRASNRKDAAVPLKAARLEAKRRIERRGPAYQALRALTLLMKLDMLLFGRVRSGPFFALLINEKSASTS